ncbi:MAG: encapsulin [Spirochaetes bacterium]|nr:encapsulin [Spirochaetota bacterium]
MTQIRQDALLRKEDLLAIENILYETKKDELVARTIAKINDRYPSYANEIGYDWYTRRGSAKIIAAGGSAKDVPFVGEDGGRETMKVFTIATGIKYTKSERMAFQAKSALGKGPAVPIDTIRVATARRYVAETENRLFFVGDASYGISGLLNKSGITSEDVAASGAGATDPDKRLWANKTSAQKLDDLLKAKESLEGDGLFKARILVLAPISRLKLIKPYSEQSPMTIQKWLESEGMYFDKIVESRAMLSTYNGLGANAFCMLDNDPEVIELTVIEDLVLGDPVYDILGDSEQAVTERTAGAIIRHPSAIYVGKGI